LFFNRNQGSSRVASGTSSSPKSPSARICRLRGPSARPSHLTADRKNRLFRIIACQVQADRLGDLDAETRKALEQAVGRESQPSAVSIEALPETECSACLPAQWVRVPRLRRRRCGEADAGLTPTEDTTTSSRSTWALRLSLSIRTVLNTAPHSARRPRPDEYSNA
jgi:hypothetical protein